MKREHRREKKNRVRREDKSEWKRGEGDKRWEIKRGVEERGERGERKDEQRMKRREKRDG